MADGGTCEQWCMQKKKRKEKKEATPHTEGSFNDPAAFSMSWEQIWHQRNTDNKTKVCTQTGLLSVCKSSFAVTQWLEILFKGKVSVISTLMKTPNLLEGPALTHSRGTCVRSSPISLEGAYIRAVCRPQQWLPGVQLGLSFHQSQI